jgi:cytidylate kinase
VGITAIIERQVAQWNAENAAAAERGISGASRLPVVTISRELGSGGAIVAKTVAENLNCSLIGYSIVETAACNLGLPKEALDCMDEKLKSQFKSWFDASFCGGVDQGDYHHCMVAIIRSMIELGAVVLLGRGAAFVDTSRRKINVRVIAPKEVRIERVMTRNGCNRRSALLAIEKSDKERSKFIKQVYGKEWRRSAEYDLVINTANTDITRVSALITCAWQIYRDDPIIEKENLRNIQLSGWP